MAKKPDPKQQKPKAMAEGGVAEKLKSLLNGHKAGGEVGMQAGGIAKLAKALKGAKEAPAAETKIIQAPTVIIPSKLSNVKEAVRQSKGDFGARRVERAADEVRNLERLYQEDALRQAFMGDNAKAMMTIKPQDFEKFAEPLERSSDFRWSYYKGLPEMTQQEYFDHLMRIEGGFSDVPYLEINKARAGELGTPWVSGHEGRHRSRALANRGEPASIVQVLPRAELREPLPRRSQEEYIEALRKELGPVIRPQQDLTGYGERNRPPIDMPDIYAKGGEVSMNKGGDAGQAAFGVFPQMKPRRSKQDREAAKNVPVDLARGFVAGALGMPGDIESLARLPYELITGNESPTFLPTSEEIEKRLPLRSDTPASRAAAGLGTLVGGGYTGPGAPIRAVAGLPGAVKKAGQDFAMAAGQSGPKIFIGPKAKTWDQAKADAATRLEKAGADPVDIWRQTGTFRGADGILRQEISDVGAKFRNPKELKELGEAKKAEALELKQRLVGIPGQKDMFPKALTEAKKPAREKVKTLKEEADELMRFSDVRGQRAKFALEHPELYAAYPDLGEIMVYQGGRGFGTESASLRGGKNDMEVEITQKGLKGDPRSSMLHEMQHAVQTLEDMAPGGSPTFAFNDPITHEIYKRRIDELKRPGTFEEFQAANRYPEDKAQAAYEEYVRTYKPFINKDIERAVQQEAAMEYYKRLAGEAESRATQMREPMSARERLQEFPYSSYDVLPEDLIVKPAKRDPLQPELGMADGGAAFGRYTTGKKYQKAVKRAKEADVNTLPDPRTYAFVSGLLGEAPDELGFSVMHPDYKGIQKAGEKGFMGGTILGMAPAVAPLTKGMPVGAAIKPVGGGPLTARQAPQEKALLLARRNAEKLGQSADPETRMLQQGYEPGWYHGSTGDITRFRSDLLGETTGAQSAKKGFFFARDPQNPPEAMLKKSSDPAAADVLRKLGIPEDEIARLNTVSMKGHGPETASGYASLGGSRGYKDAMRKANSAEKRGDWSEYEKQMQIAEDLEITRMHYTQGLVAKYGDVRDEMLDAIQNAIYSKKLPQDQAELLDQKVKELMPYGWYNSYSNPQLDGLKKELAGLVGEDSAKNISDKINKFKSVKNERAVAEKTQEGGNVMPVALRYEKPMFYDFEGKPYRDQSYSDLVDQALAAGNDALILKNTYDPGGGPSKLVDVGVVFNPDQIRSKFAAFDPLRKTAATAAASGLAAPDLLAEEQKKASGGEVKMAEGGSVGDYYKNLLGMKEGGEVKSDCGCQHEPKMATGGVARTLKGLLGIGAKAEKVEHPLVFPRATPKTKEEIRPIAQRMAEQMTGDFVRQNPKKTTNPADKSRRQWEREQSMPLETRNLVPAKKVPPVDYEKFKDYAIVGVPGDPSMGGVAKAGSLEASAKPTVELTRVGDIVPDQPVPLFGGPRFGDEEKFWASNLSAAKPMQTNVTELSELYDSPVLGKYIKMAPDSANFAIHNLDSLLSIQRPERLDPPLREKLDELIRKGSPKYGKFPGFTGFQDPVDVLLQSQLNSNLRKHIAETLTKPTITDALGLPNGLDVVAAITHPELRNLEIGVSGFSVGKMRPGAVLKAGESAHPTYDTDIPGALIGRNKYPTPYEIAFPDTTAYARSQLKPGVQEFNMIKLLGPRERIDQQYIDEMKMFEELMKQYTGKKKGGAVKSGLSAIKKA